MADVFSEVVGESVQTFVVSDEVAESVGCGGVWRGGTHSVSDRGGQALDYLEAVHYRRDFGLKDVKRQRPAAKLT